MAAMVTAAMAASVVNVLSWHYLRGVMGMTIQRPMSHRVPHTFVTGSGFNALTNGNSDYR
jgi:hypothetical protein